MSIQAIVIVEFLAAVIFGGTALARLTRTLRVESAKSNRESLLAYERYRRRAAQLDTEETELDGLMAGGDVDDLGTRYQDLHYQYRRAMVAAERRFLDMDFLDPLVDHEFIPERDPLVLRLKNQLAEHPDRKKEIVSMLDSVRRRAAASRNDSTADT